MLVSCKFDRNYVPPIYGSYFTEMLLIIVGSVVKKMEATFLVFFDSSVIATVKAVPRTDILRCFAYLGNLQSRLIYKA